MPHDASCATATCCTSLGMPETAAFTASKFWPVVDNLPAVPAEKYDKLTAILTKIFGGSGRIREGGLFHPQDEATKRSKGYAFVEYENAEQARAAQAALNGYQLDKAHKFAATLFDEADRLAKVPDEYGGPEERTYAPAENLLEWLSDKRGRDQFAIRYGDETEVCWNDAPKQQEETVYKRSFWSEAFVEWSPQGSMLATVHRQGVAMWGGASFGRLMRVSHPNVQRLLISPCERFLLTFSEFPDGRGRPHVSAIVKGAAAHDRFTVKAVEGERGAGCEGGRKMAA
ncbi:hypothetical protein CHLNCDRAFT_59481 [Chlorella variabilis]|uniref:RRM domain-containing protein n=1 Tax=Chlorella variabilis TaxID=554065 RepID=E1ZU79_CHLVA|nr:hypothetical protein CHLNCDRAFT_59481 [Chlorella variabilis]EFN50617.1 hypothetical protein CHLNCDRAFT_59481 [Chlorella variabilis]|eukprot:XP_005852304.1 hypothetical protein CHLNCDRAFT_59481 [Chlorella variabilis]